jgi:hypothetical protein
MEVEPFDLIINLNSSDTASEVMTIEGESTIDWSSNAIDNVSTNFGNNTITGNDAANETLCV